MDSITEAAKMLNKLCERIGVIDMNAVELCISYLIETCSELENRVRNLERIQAIEGDKLHEHLQGR